ncbi:glycosyltransferase [Marivirga tractuosa]|uniref:glycosyltransferase n=1 Tax=Marivirga tractuosa TaxID=1006 RepID=UPI0030C7D178
MPFEKFVVTTGTGEFADKNGIPLASPSFYAKTKRILNRKIKKEDYRIQQIKLLEKFFQQNIIDHVLFQYGTTAEKAYLACVNLSIPFTVHFHGYDAYSLKYGKSYYKYILEYCSNVIVVSQHMKNQLIYLGCQADKISLIPYGSNFEIDHNLVEYKTIKRKFLAVGRFVEKKAPYITILAFAEALKINKEITLDMVGEGDLLPVCKDIVIGLGLENNIKFHGACSHDMVKRMMHETDVFIQHSKRAENGDCEGLPNSIIEALMLKKPVISTFHSGIPEIVKDSVNGFLKNEGDLIGTKDKILEAIEYDFEFPEMEYLKLENSIKRLTSVLNGQ